ncbi:MAG: hypothetical protein J1E98_08195 [Lachnospiraceae bacterium]|nr:hypothetical protein [Lachnospiraceae bacterium]
MDYIKVEKVITEEMPEKKTINRQELIEITKKINPEFKETLLRNLLEKLLNDEVIVRVGRNQYQKKNLKTCKEIYKNQYSEEAQIIIEKMQQKYPLLDYRVWEIRWLNEFWNHQIAQNKIFIEVERLGCEFVYTELSEEYLGNILIRPNEKELYRYGGQNTIIVDRLVSEAPKGKPECYNTPLEKVIVDLFANKNLRSMVHIGEYARAIHDMFNKYYIDQTKLFRYADRRNKKEEISRFLTEEAGVEVTKGA